MVVAARQIEVSRWEEAHNSYRGLLETLSLTLHPFNIADSAPQTSAQVESQLTAAVEGIATLAQCYQLPARHAAMTKVHKQVPALAALVDFWWQGVHQDLEPFCLTPRSLSTKQAVGLVRPSLLYGRYQAIMPFSAADASMIQMLGER